MQTAIIPLVQEIECYICGSKNIEKVCHHCGRAMCVDHGPFTAPVHRFYNRIQNDEYTGLDLPDTGKSETAVHCEYCNHYTVTYEPVFGAMALVGIAAVIASFASSPIWLTIILTGLGMMTFAISVWAIFFQWNYRFRRMKALFSPLPVWGRFPEIILTETVKGTVAVNSDGRYNAYVVEKIGDLSFSLQMGASDLERLSQYRRKYKLSNLAEVPFHAGFAVLSGTKRLQSENGNYTSKEVNPVQLKEHTVDPSLQNSTGHGGEWKHQHSYRFSLDKQPSSGLPVQIIPTLLSEGEDWSLGLYIQVNTWVDPASLSRPVLEELVLETPSVFGRVENVMPSADVRPDQEQHYQRIRWQNISLVQSNQVNSKNFSVRFLNSKEIKPDLDVMGQLRLKFDGSISGLTDISLFSPSGQKRTAEEGNIIQSSEVVLHFNFSLAALCLRRSYSLSHFIEHPTAIPGNEMITRLVNAMSNRGDYVQRVIENPPQMNWADAHIMNRLWVIAGRRYRKATPIDFRIVAGGQEQYEDNDIPYDGKSQFEITVQGTIIKEEMYADIVDLQNDIVEIIQCTPALQVVLGENKLSVNESCVLIGIMENIGEVVAKDISISAAGVKVIRPATIPELEPGKSEQFTLWIYPKRLGTLPVTIIAMCRDKFGQLPPYKQHQQLFVKENRIVRTIGNQTNFYGPSSGSIHTGSGDIENNDK